MIGEVMQIYIFILFKEYLMDILLWEFEWEFECHDV